MHTMSAEHDTMNQKEGSITTQERATRLYFVDVLRVALTVLVIAHHAGQAYGPTGGDWPISEFRRSALLRPFFAVNPMFFMGLFFLFAGYFAAYAYDRRGALAFLKGRFARLGLPILFCALFVFGPIAYFDRHGSFVSFIGRLYRNAWKDLYVHLWFLGHLLVYSIGYVLWRLLVRRGTYPAGPEQTRAVRTRTVLLINGAFLFYAVALMAVTWAVRIWHPLDRWSALLFVVPSEYAHLPQYVSMFLLGTIAYRGDWLRRLPTATGMVWLGVGLAAVVTFYTFDLRAARFLYGIVERGGRNWGSLIFCAWEALVCTGLGVGLLVLFRALLNRPPGKLLSAVIGAQYAAYIIHVLVVLGIQAGLQAVQLPPFTKFVIVTIVGTILSFGIGHLLKQIPGVNKIL
jgi:glucan biosynthesis protein C